MQEYAMARQQILEEMDCRVSSQTGTVLFHSPKRDRAFQRSHLSKIRPTTDSNGALCLVFEERGHHWVISFPQLGLHPLEIDSEGIIRPCQHDSYAIEKLLTVADALRRCEVATLATGSLNRAGDSGDFPSIFEGTPMSEAVEFPAWMDTADAWYWVI
jgi:hypothetical protein